MGQAKIGRVLQGLELYAGDGQEYRDTETFREKTIVDPPPVQHEVLQRPHYHKYCKDHEELRPDQERRAAENTIYEQYLKGDHGDRQRRQEVDQASGP